MGQAEIVKLALEEDIGTGDVTSKACIPEDRQATGYFLAREEMTLSGVEVLPLIYENLTLLHKNGDTLQDGDRIAEVSGNARRLLECERVALNFLQRLSGVASLARQYAKAVEGTGCKVLDTRKTTPGLRQLEKTIQQSRNLVPEDNLSPAEAAKWVSHINRRATIELSGGITLSTVRAYAETGADYVSSGAITHSATAKDISFRLQWNTPENVGRVSTGGGLQPASGSK